MGLSKVWYMNARARRFLESTAIKGRQILEHSGWLDRLQTGDIIAVKTHMGEAYNVGYLRPVIIRTLVDLLKERGLRPFVTDTTTMPYHPWISRTLAMDHLDTANKNGFSQGTVGCPIVMADGWLGTDDVVVDLQGRGRPSSSISLLTSPRVATATAGPTPRSSTASGSWPPTTRSRSTRPAST